MDSASKELWQALAALVVVAALLFGVAALAPAEVVMATPAQVQTSAADDNGSFTVGYDVGPRVIYKAATAPDTWDHVIPIPPGEICEVRTFLGWDRGSIGEATLELNLLGARLAERSDHKETLQGYEAWDHRTTRRRVRAGDTVHLHGAAQQLAPNATDGGLSTRVQVAFRLRMVQVGGSCQ